jgi:hypothetical protein
VTLPPTGPLQLGRGLLAVLALEEFVEGEWRVIRGDDDLGVLTVAGGSAGTRRPLVPVVSQPLIALLIIVVVALIVLGLSIQDPLKGWRGVVSRKDSRRVPDRPAIAGAGHPALAAVLILGRGPMLLCLDPVGGSLILVARLPVQLGSLHMEAPSVFVILPLVGAGGPLSGGHGSSSGFPPCVITGVEGGLLGLHREVSEVGIACSPTPLAVAVGVVDVPLCHDARSPSQGLVGAMLRVMIRLGPLAVHCSAELGSMLLPQSGSLLYCSLLG